MIYSGFYYDKSIIWLIAAFIITLVAQLRVKSVFASYSKKKNAQGYTGKQIAEKILNANGLHDVSVTAGGGSLTDHYDPTKRIVSLSEDVYNKTSVAAIGVAAHEVGHAIQHAAGFSPLRLRSMVVPAANIGSRFGPYLAMIGIFVGIRPFMYIGIGLFAVAVLFYLVTLPVEFDASRRAVKSLMSYGLVYEEEIKGVKKVLNAAAFTYVAAAAAAVANLLRLILLSRRRDD